MKHFTVVAAIIINDGKILCMQRKASKYDYISFKYEFPGGKVEIGEGEEAALLREIREELDMPIEINRAFLKVNHQYPDFHLTMYSYLCSTSVKVPQLKEHVAYRWLSHHELLILDWAAADVPIVAKLLQN
jgi:8-oxo-dGTP diphosphatase